MSGAARKVARVDTVRTLRALPYLAGFTEVSAWAQSVDSDALPCWGIATPQEPRAPDTQDSYRDEMSLVVTVKRAGGDGIEDALDDDADVLDRALTGALRLLDRACDLVRSEVRIDGQGELRVGTLNMIFTVVVWTGNP